MLNIQALPHLCSTEILPLAQNTIERHATCSLLLTVPKEERKHQCSAWGPRNERELETQDACK